MNSKMGMKWHALVALDRPSWTWPYDPRPEPVALFAVRVLEQSQGRVLARDLLHESWS